MTSDQNTKRITLALDLLVQPWHKRSYRVTLGSIVEEGRKAQSVERVKQRALAMLASTDVGPIVRVGLADGFVYCCPAPSTAPTRSTASIRSRVRSVRRRRCTCTPSSRASGSKPWITSATVVERRHNRARNRAADADGSLRELARKAGVPDDGEFEDMAQRLGLAYAAADRREEQAAQGDRAVALSADIVAAGSSIEGAALARLLGLPSDVSVAVLRRTATEIVASSRAGKYAGTLRNCASRSARTMLSRRSTSRSISAARRRSHSKRQRRRSSRATGTTAARWTKPLRRRSRRTACPTRPKPPCSKTTSSSPTLTRTPPTSKSRSVRSSPASHALSARARRRELINERGFVYMHTPIITGSDAEGAGEMFQVTTLPLDGTAPKNDDGSINYKEDFFDRSTNLTVSGQLEGELAAMAFSDIYTFGPTFRAENSNTTRHLAEFWMIEPEVAFNDLEDNMNLAEDFIKYIIRYAMEHNKEDLEFLAQRLAEEEKQKPQQDRSEMGLIEKLEFVVNNEFERLTYTQAIDILRESNHNKKKKFQYLVDKWGVDLQSEHERYLVEKHFKKPVILTDYPKEIKSFYMRLNEDGKTVVVVMNQSNFKTPYYLWINGKAAEITALPHSIATLVF